MNFALRVLIILFLWHSTVELKIIFPQIDDFPVDCKDPDGSNGTCRNLQYCPAAITANKVNSCYFDGDEEYVCCKNNVWDDAKLSKSTSNCGVEELPFEIISGLRTEYKEFSYMVNL